MGLGVLSTAGEWTHDTVQTTFLLVPRRGRVVFAKLSAAALLGAVLVCAAVVLSAVVIAILQPSADWGGTTAAVVTVVAAGAALTVTGAGTGVAVANAPAAVTGLYVTLLGVFPILRAVQPALADRLDPVNAVLALTEGPQHTVPVLVIAGWPLVAAIAAALTAQRSIS
jgi:hypothetical protein